jgi:hypothetical protein
MNMPERCPQRPHVRSLGRRSSLGVTWLILATASAAGDPGADLAAARRALLADLTELIGWGTERQLYRDRAATCELVLRFDQDHAAARKWLGYERRAGAWVRSGRYVQPKNVNAKAHAEYRARSAVVARRFADAVLAVLSEGSEHLPRALRREAIEDVLLVDPDNDKAREMDDAARLGARWVLGETARGGRRRRELADAAKVALDAVPTPRATALSTLETRLGAPWVVAVETATWRVVATTSREEACAAARIATAAAPLFETCFSVVERPPADQIYFMMVDELDWQSALVHHPGCSPAFRKFASSLTSVNLPESEHCLVHAKESEMRLEFAARWAVASLLRRHFGITAARGWAYEGVGLYLTELLTGSHLTYMVRPSRYAPDEGRLKAELWAKIRHPRSDWFEIAGQLVREHKNPDLAFLLSKDVNTMDAGDLVYAYVMAAYLLEGQADRAPKLLRAIGQGEVPFHDAIPDTLDLDLPGLERRVQVWLTERR